MMFCGEGRRWETSVVESVVADGAADVGLISGFEVFEDVASEVCKEGASVVPSVMPAYSLHDAADVHMASREAIQRMSAKILFM